jgi:hypothetical protein
MLRRVLVGIAAIAALVGCRDPAEIGSTPSRVPSTSMGGAPSRSVADARSARDVVVDALEAFRSFPAIHGTVRYEGPEAVLVYELWVRDPAARIELPFGGQTIPWVTDGERSSIEEPHLHAGVLFLVDPRQDLLYSCDGPCLAGSMQILGRTATGIRCPAGESNALHWVDELSGLILRGRNTEGEPWSFTDLEFDPVFPPDVFDVGAS